ncbi:hypothetical protein AB6A40_002380 [Gnathostoma spinigerum]|uniref:AB hydrolase-1 domain-containing protein n=1 Tax=Gnathostoma spinigerum TaxID=75299 RepID=A0ABD6EE58_9BILA
MQTLFRQLFRPRPSLSFEREIIGFDDGGECAVDWMFPKGTNELTPLVVYLPGITGSTHDCAYILHSVAQSSTLGYRSVVVNCRGLGGVPLKTPRTYNAANTSDLKYIMSLIRDRFPHAPKIGCGFSMGGMLLWNYLASFSSADECGLKAALCISSPWNPVESSFEFEKFFPRVVFNAHLAENLKRLISPYEEMFAGICDWEAVMASKTVREFDKAFVVPVFGYNTWLDYYQDAALDWKVDRIPIPTLCLNAADDCFSPVGAIPFQNIARSKNVAVAVTEHGGHLAFMRDSNPASPGLIDDLIVQFSSMIFSGKSI